MPQGHKPMLTKLSSSSSSPWSEAEGGGENRGDCLLKSCRGEKLAPRRLRWIPWVEMELDSPMDALQMAASERRGCCRHGGVSLSGASLKRKTRQKGESKISSASYGGFPTIRHLGLTSRRRNCSRSGRISGKKNCFG
jgi:hypothetical protein